MVGGAIHGLGVPMGDANLPDNIEDPAFNLDYVKAESKAEGKAYEHAKFINQVRVRIAERNAKYPIWGWKYPRVNLYLEEIIENIKNPCLVVVFRDPIPTAMRAVKRMTSDDPEREGRVLYTMNSLIQMNRRNLLMIQTLKIPTLMVSYERATSHKEAFLAELATFLRKPLPEDLNPLLSFIEPGSYKRPLMLTSVE